MLAGGWMRVYYYYYYYYFLLSFVFPLLVWQLFTF